MLHPSYTDLMNIVNGDVEEGEEPVISSRYSIVMATAKRARQIIGGEEPLVEIKQDKPLSIAIEELVEGKIKIMPEDLSGRLRMKILFISLGCDKNLVDSK
ncbi:MAG: DNA-directed RNA polymerase subunit omega [Lachnospiraceae bacterium]